MTKELDLLNPQDDARLADGFVKLLAALNTGASLVNICINLLLIYLIYKMRLFRKISYRFIMCLSISDLGVGLLVQPILTARLLIHNKTQLMLIRLCLQFFGIIFVQTSAILTAVISLDRYLHMKHLMYYNTHMTKRRANLLIALTLILSWSIGIGITISTIYNLTIYVNTCWLSLNVAILFVTAVFYTRAYLSIKKRIAHVTFSSEKMSRNQRIQRPDLEFIKGMVFILVALLVFYVPYEITGLLIFFLPKSASVQTRRNVQYGFYSSILCLYVMSIYNAIILIMFDRKLKDFFKGRILRRRKTNKPVSVIRDTTMCLEDLT